MEQWAGGIVFAHGGGKMDPRVATLFGLCALSLGGFLILKSGFTRIANRRFDVGLIYVGMVILAFGYRPELACLVTGVRGREMGSPSRVFGGLCRRSVLHWFGSLFAAIPLARAGAPTPGDLCADRSACPRPHRQGGALESRAGSAMGTDFDGIRSRGHSGAATPKSRSQSLRLGAFARDGWRWQEKDHQSIRLSRARTSRGGWRRHGSALSAPCAGLVRTSARSHAKTSGQMNAQAARSSMPGALRIFMRRSGPFQ